MYYSDIDTTFCLFNKKYKDGSHIRIAGDFTMKHLPWYINVSGLSRLSRYLMYKDASSVSSVKYLEMQYIKENNFIPIQKRDETFLIQMNDDANDAFWKDIYPTWKNEIFDIFDVYLKKDKQFLDIGAGIGGLSLYASRLSSYVVCVESDPIIAERLQHNINTNLLDTKFDIEIDYKNSVFAVIEKYNLHNLSLINLDIQGDEEYIFDNLLEYCKSVKVPIYITFYYEKWHDKNVDRFLYLNECQKEIINRSLVSSILFDYSVSP